MSNELYYLFAAVMVVWLGTFVYVVWLLKQQRRMRTDVNRLTRIVDELKDKQK